ncbi:MAG: sugar kinase, ribokinase [Chthoniobacter sp.]|nr:sugar kinase, ribokinase [Chthoniobacter sp.]
MSFKAVGIGEVLWDVFPSGKKMGGAPANFAYHAYALGATASVVSRVGDDALGREILARLQTLGLPTDCVGIDSDYPTGTVTVEVAADGQPQYTIHEGVAWDHLAADAAALAAVKSADVVCFGSLGQRCEPSRTAIRTMIASSPRTALRIFDINLRQTFFSRELIQGSLEIANILKLNDTELPVLVRLLNLSGADEQQQLAELAERYGLRLVAYTCGARGSMLYDGARWSEHSGIAIEVKDTVGAGDSFTAAVAIGMLAGWDLQTMGDRANEIAAYVCSCDGATPPMPEHLRAPFQNATFSSHV